MTDIMTQPVNDVAFAVAAPTTKHGRKTKTVLNTVTDTVVEAVTDTGHDDANAPIKTAPPAKTNKRKSAAAAKEATDGTSRKRAKPVVPTTDIPSEEPVWKSVLMPLSMIH